MNYAKKIIKVLLFIIIFFVILNEVTHIFKSKDGTWCIEPIYYEEDIDVIFLGTSATDVGIIPMQLWEEQGIVAYNAGCPLSVFPVMYYWMEDFIDRFSPKVIFVDIDLINYECNNDEYHYTLDKMKFSSSKLKLINAVIPIEKRLEFFFPIITYHGNWKNINYQDFQKLTISNDKAVTYGERSEEENIARKRYNNKVEEFEWPFFNNTNVLIAQTDERTPIQNSSEKYIKQMIQLCNNNNVKLIFLGMPSIELEKRKEMNGVKALLENIDAEYIDFYELAEELQLNASEDFGDIIHLDVKGAKKVTSYIGKYLKGKGYVSDRRNDKEFSEWHKYYENSIYKEFYFDK